MLEQFKTKFEDLLSSSSDIEFFKINSEFVSNLEIKKNFDNFEKAIKSHNTLKLKSLDERVCALLFLATNRFSFQQLSDQEIKVTQTSTLSIEQLLDLDLGLNYTTSSIINSIIEDKPLNISEKRNIDKKGFANFLGNFVPGVEIKVEEKRNEHNVSSTKYPRPALATDYEQAQTELEKNIKSIWERYLNIDDIGVNDLFFELGGNSVLALSILADVNKIQDKKLTIVKLFQYPTIREIANFLDSNQERKKFMAKKVIRASKDIAVISMAGKFPSAQNTDEFWQGIKNSKNLISKFSNDELHPSMEKSILMNQDFVRACGLYPGFDEFDALYFGMTPREAQILDPQHRKLLELSIETFENAAINPYTYKGRIGVYVGMANTTYIHNIYQHKNVVEDFGELNILFSNEKDYIATRVSHKLNLKGPALSIHTACSTSLVTIIEATKAIRNGECEMALAGGISINAQPFKGHLFQEGGILSKDGKCAPFDSKATGTVFNDGGTLVLLKDLELAIKDGDNILGVIKGVATNNDGADKVSYTAPSINGQSEVIFDALNDANINASEINYVEAHGTGTPVGDPIEIEALSLAYRQFTDDKDYCFIGSVKSNIGHLTCAAGGAGFIKALKVLEERVVPKMANLNQPNENIDFNNTPFKLNSTNVSLDNKQILNIGISSFGVGGTNAHLILQSFDQKRNYRSMDNEYLFNISAKSEDQLKVLEGQLLDRLESEDPSRWQALSYSLSCGRINHPYRKSLVIEKDKIRDTKKTNVRNRFRKNKKTIFMFPGQGSQYIGMGKQLYEKYEVFKETFDRCALELDKYLDKNIKDIIFAQNMSEEDAYNALKNTYYTQPAIFALEFSIATLLLDLEVEVDGFIGHSVGEFVAATLAGVFTLEDALMLICKRSSLMTDLPKGSMLSVSLDLNEIKKYLSHDIQLAAYNGPGLSVVAGPDEKVDDLIKLLEKNEVNCKRLHTSHAFHSNMMNPILDEYEKVVSKVKLRKPSIKIYSTVKVGSDDEIFSSPKYWADHMRAPVLFGQSILKLLEKENPILVEIGPRSVLTTLATKTAVKNKIKDLNIYSTLSSEPKVENKTLLKSLGGLWCSGNQYRIDKLYEEDQRLKLPFTVYPFVKKKVWLDWIKNKEEITKEIINDKVKETNLEGETMTTSVLNQLKESLAEIFEKSSGIDILEFDNETTFLEMGMDSLFLTQISLKIKKELYVDVTFRQLSDEYNTLDDLVNYLEPKVPKDMFNVAPASQENSTSAQLSNSQVQKPSVQKPSVQKPSVQQSVYQQAQPVTQPVYQQPMLDSSVQGIINQQLSLMNQQLQLLSGNSVMSQAPQREQKEISTNTAKPIASTPAKPVHQNTVVRSEQEKKNRKPVSVNNAKKAYGAIARITTFASSDLTDKQKDFMTDFFKSYSEKTKSSKDFTQRNRVNHSDPRVVTGFKPEMKEVTYPIVVNKSKAQHLWDLDGNKYIDMTNGFGCNFFGYQNPLIKKYVLEQLDAGIETGPQHALTEDVSRLVSELTGNERVAFCNTGSEAVLGAMRIARTVSGKDKIISFNGSYHGIHDEVIIRGAKGGRPVSAAPGITDESVSNMIVLDYGTQESLEKIKEIIDDVAAVLVEPVQSRRCDFQPAQFLKELEQITKSSDTCLIFDEVITGFRIKVGGAQEYFNVDADICCYGKIVGGGMPIGVVAGSSKYLDALDGGYWQYGDDSTPTVGVTYFAGTFVRHPLALAAAKGSLEIIKEGGNELLDRVSDTAQNFVDQLNMYFKLVGAPIKFDNFGGLMKPKWTQELYHGDLLFALLKYHGVHVYDGYPWYMNMAHTEEDIQFVIEQIKKCINIMQAHGFIPANENFNKSQMIFAQSNPPEEGAILGVDEDGNPAWYVNDKSGKLKKIV